MFDWIYSNREAFLINYVEILRNHSAADKLQEEHNQQLSITNVIWSKNSFQFLPGVNTD